MVVELNKLTSPVETIANYKTFQMYDKAKVKFKDYEKHIQTYFLNELIEWFVCFIGIFSSQWPLFLGVILLSFLGKLYKDIVILRMVDNVICIALLLFAVLNRFHLHIDLTGYVTSFIGI
jgi:hypothetical protein